MTSEELEISLRTEFENHLKDTLAAVRQEVTEFQKNFEAEFAKHRSQLDEAIRMLSERVSTPPELDKGFAESVVEHLRLARDEGAQITATAFGEAEKLRTESADTSRYDVLRNAINDISAQSSQAAILRSLVEHAAEFAPRGAFFILKNEQFVGWKVFGAAGEKTDADVQAVRFAAADPTLLSKCVDALATAEGAYGSHEDDSKFLEPLEFGRPDRMYAIPLTARGRGVAVLYADYGTDGVSLNIEALETLVRVAGLTVELRAAAPVAAPAHVEPRPVEEPAAAEPAAAEYHPEPSPESSTSYVHEPAHDGSQEADSGSASDAEPVHQEYADAHTEEQVSEPSHSSYSEPQEEFADHSEPMASPFDSPVEEIQSPAEEYTGEVVYDEPAELPVEAVEYEYQGTPVEHDQQADSVAHDGEFETFSSGSVEQDSSMPDEAQHVQVEVERSFESEPSAEASEPFAAPAEPGADVEEPAAQPVEVQHGYTNGKPAEAAETPVQPAVEGVGAAQFKGRFSDRMLDLPIDVPEEERKLHNNARRFARLLVSEIKLYNEQKVVEGREAADLYDRLREAIDRSREMYDKRVEAHVADKFDYFHYELVNSLAEGDTSKLGENYPEVSA